MRIVAGTMRGLKLEGGEDRSIRPTADRTREGLFNVLAHNSHFRTDRGACPNGSTVLDLFAGSGALGLEALSRGAAQVTFVEKAETSLKVLRQNIARARADNTTRIIRRDALKPGRPPVAHDLVLMDPPYGQDMAATALSAARDDGWLAAGAFVIVETDGADPFGWPEGFTAIDQRKHGRATLHFGQAD
ncbi:MAG: 16S rRNA (guanine(966)-N(2))-methyltransferase RsmD [Minwuia sp.]|nr:16S rRNA (guanine(966)-N(2))-methyltransferase RsmD [Minwuia sp.]